MCIAISKVQLRSLQVLLIALKLVFILLVLAFIAILSIILCEAPPFGAVLANLAVAHCLLVHKLPFVHYVHYFPKGAIV